MKKIIFIVLISIIVAPQAFADPVTTFYTNQSIARFFNLPQSARGLALGGTETPLTRGSHAIFGNPAGLGFLRQNHASGTLGHDSHTGAEFFSEEDIDEEDPNGHLLVAMPLSRDAQGISQSGTLGIGYSRYNGSSSDSIHTKNDGHTRTIAYGIPLSSSVSLGYGFTFFDDQLRSDLADYHAHARIRHTLGGEYEVTKNFNLGLVLFYGLGQSDFEEFSVQSDGLTHQKQWSSDLGTSYQLGDTLLSASFSFDRYLAKGDLPIQSNLIVVGDNEDGSAYGYHAGVEQSITPTWKLRGGYHYQQIEGYRYEHSNTQTLSGGVQFSAISFGIGYSLKELGRVFSNLSLDYGLQYRTAGRGEWEHLLGVGVSF